MTEDDKTAMLKNISFHHSISSLNDVDFAVEVRMELIFVYRLPMKTSCLKQESLKTWLNTLLIMLYSHQTHRPSPFPR